MSTQAVSKTIRCDLINNVLCPNPQGAVSAELLDSTDQQGSRTTAVIFGGSCKGFITYDDANTRPVSYVPSIDDPLGHVSQSIGNILASL